MSLINSVCSIIDTLSSIVNVVAKPTITVTKSNDIDCRNPQAQLNATGGIPIYGFLLQILITQILPILWFIQMLIHGISLQLALHVGCKWDSVLVRSDLTKGQANILVPNAFTPNQDGLNDCFGVRYWSVTHEFELSI